MRTRLFALMLTLPGALYAQYTYYLTDSLTSINSTNWYQNGAVTGTASGLTASTTNGGALISKLAVPDGSANYEIRSTLTIPASGGTYVQLLRATSNAMSGPAAAGTYYSVELQNPTWTGSPASCTATLAVYKRVSNTVTLLTSSSITCYNGMVLRTVVRGSSFMVIISSQYVGTIYGWPGSVTFTDSAITSGVAGVGAYNTPSGNAISPVQIGILDQVAPGAIDPNTIENYLLPNRVELQWPGAVDNPGGIGLWGYQIYRGSTLIGQTFTPEFDDDSVTPGTTYSYTIYAVDQHMNVSGGATAGATTLPAGSIDARRIGVSPLGSYWGDAGEQIDTRSGNLNFTLPVYTVMGRVGNIANFALNYNSQVWRLHYLTSRNLGRDVGFGYGWQLLAGSITPIWQNSYQLDHFIYTDSTGAEYRLDQYNSASCMWTSVQGVYAGYNPCANRLYFPDGSFWIMGATSGGAEQDAGVMYPTQMEDTNGNQVFLSYQTGLSATLPNSSARITSIEDVRAVYTGGGPNGYETYSFAYNMDVVPHLTGTTSHITGVGNWSFTPLENQALNSPFLSNPSFGTTTMLQSATRVGEDPQPTSFQYDPGGSGELIQVTTAQGGVLAWSYRTFTYTGSVSWREVQSRTLTMKSGGTQYNYPITRNDSADASLSFHSGATLDDPSGIGEKAWTFATSGSAWLIGLLTQYEDRPSAAQASQPLQRKTYTWVQDSAGMPYIGTVLTTLNPTGANVQTQTTQTLDTHGNVTQTATYDYGNLSTPARTYNYALNYSFTSNGFTSYRVTSATVNNGGTPVTLVTNTYDSTALTNIASVREHDSSYGTGVSTRGNLTVTTPVGGATTTITRDIAGNVLSTTDSMGSAVSSTLSTATNYVAPDAVTPNSNANLTTSAGYTPSLMPSSVTGPNGATASMTYDGWNRPHTSTSIYGAQTSYSYSSALPYVIIATTTNTNGTSHYTQTTLDGFGRAITVVRGTGSTVVSEVDTTYAPCSCSPLGKVQTVSQPYVPGNQPVYTTYTYDGMGRTVSVLLPDGASTTTYAYSGNTTTTTDPAGKWKMQTMDAMGDLTQVNEPNPAGGANYVTSYTYDILSHLTLVTMPRLSGTQTRSFVYDSNQRLQSETHPESGAKTYTYNADGTLATRTDANNHVTKYTYDTYKRLTMKSYWYTLNNNLTEDTCQRLTLTYDTNTINTTYSQNSWGRLVTAQFWGGPGCPLNITSPPPLAATTSPFVQMYSYNVPGQITGKRLQVTREPASKVLSANLDGTFSYDNEGHMLNETYPITYTVTGNNPPVQQTQLSYTYSYDGMGRPYSAVYNPTSTTWPTSAQYGPSDQLTYLNGSLTRTYNSLLQVTNKDGYLYYYPASGNNGRITSMTHPGTNETVSYAYDSLNRLSSASGAGVPGVVSPWTETYTYDGFGNLLDKTETGGAPSLMQAVNSSTNRITSQSYDANGNQLNGGTYDYENRVILNSDLYVYGPDNLRVWKARANGTEEIYFYDPAGRRLGVYYVLTYNNSTLFMGATTTSFYFKGELMSTTGKLTTPIDRLGSTYNGAGYFPYGEEYQASANDTDKFATYYRDATTGLDYAKARYYSNILGRFMSADPSNSGNPADPGSWNRYAYAMDDPVDLNDPSGLDGQCPPGTLCIIWNPPTSSGITIPTFGAGSIFGFRQRYADRSSSQIDQPGTGSLWSPCPNVPVHTAIGPNNAQIRQNVQDAVAFNNELNSLVASGVMNSATAWIARIDYMYEEFRTGGPQDYKSNPALTPGTPEYNQMDAFGNFNFGAVGQSLGFASGFLQFSAGLASFEGLVAASLSQVDSYGALKSYLPPDWGTPLTGPSWGDNPANQGLIGQGALWGAGFLGRECK